MHDKMAIAREVCWQASLVSPMRNSKKPEIKRNALPEKPKNEKKPKRRLRRKKNAPRLRPDSMKKKNDSKKKNNAD